MQSASLPTSAQRTPTHGLCLQRCSGPAFLQHRQNPTMPQPPVQAKLVARSLSSRSLFVRGNCTWQLTLGIGMVFPQLKSCKYLPRSHMTKGSHSCNAEDFHIQKQTVKCIWPKWNQKYPYGGDSWSLPVRNSLQLYCCCLSDVLYLSVLIWTVSNRDSARELPAK